MKRKDFLASLGLLTGTVLVPSSKSEKLILPAKNSNADMTFGVNDEERMRITSNGTPIFISSRGNVGGTTSPNYKLTINN
jgi:hypothetical protein